MFGLCFGVVMMIWLCTCTRIGVLYFVFGVLCDCVCDMFHFLWFCVVLVWFLLFSLFWGVWDDLIV